MHEEINYVQRMRRGGYAFVSIVIRNFLKVCAVSFFIGLFDSSKPE